MRALKSRAEDLEERSGQSAGSLSGGEQQMLAIGRALMAKPSLLLLDEPSLGLAPIIVETVLKVLAQINEAGVSILLVEQNAIEALKLAARGYVLEEGRIVTEGEASALLDDERAPPAGVFGALRLRQRGGGAPATMPPLRRRCAPLCLPRSAGETKTPR